MKPILMLFIGSYLLMKIYFSRAAESPELLCSSPVPRRYPIKTHRNLVIFPSTDFPTQNRSFSLFPCEFISWRNCIFTCIISSISRSTSSAVLSGSSGLWVSVLLDKIKACMSKSVATASSSLLKSSSSGL